jgi:protocatechuate 3,4-dioxygenase beta subunit
MLPTLLALTLLVGGDQVARPGTLGGTTPEMPKGTAVIRGRVTAADTGRPLRRAQIRVTALEFPQGRTTSTNVRGEYELKDLPPGRYTINVSRSGYLPMQYGQRRYGELGKPVQLDEGRVIEKLEFTLPRAGVMSGRINDETGEPVSGVTVWAMRTEYFRGRRRAVPIGNNVITDDTGQYRLIGMPPGEYTVMAWLRDTWVAGPQKHTFGYATTYYPGTPSYADAQRVKVGVGQETPNLDFSLIAGRTATLSGTALRSDGTPLADANVSLSREVAGPTTSSSFGLSGATVGDDGSWTIKNVAPGEYTLEVSTRDRIPERASMDVMVQGTEMSGITLTTNAGGTLNGRVVTDDGQPLPASGMKPRVMSETIGANGRPSFLVSGDDNGLLDAQGDFSLRGVIGPAMVRVSLPSGWRIKAVELGGDDYAEKPLDLKSGERVDGVRIVVTNRFPSVSGRVTDSDAKPVEGTVLLIPADESKWADGARLLRARPDQTGLYRLEGVRPDDYLAVAVEYAESWQLQDPEYLATLRDAAQRVTVREGQPLQLDLKIKR